MSATHKFPYKWFLKDGYPAKGIEKHGKTVFGTFICGGGSSMGYKLAGYNHLGGVEIDPQVAAVYEANHHPQLLYNEDIRLFTQRTEYPKELYNLDLLDGSPPCSSFSMAGNREKDWGKNKVFREGQADQKLDDLFFTYIALAEKLQPKIVLAENVKGLIQGNAKFYVSRIKKEFESAGYKVQLFLLNAASMGVPQKRERVFFICQRKDLKLPELKLNFTESSIPFKLIDDGDVPRKPIENSYLFRWQNANHTGRQITEKGNTFGFMYRCKPELVCNTITSAGSFFWDTKPALLTKNELCKIGSYPLDYNFQKMEPQYLIGMSVPPVMTAQIANQIYLQWLSKL